MKTYEEKLEKAGEWFDDNRMRITFNNAKSRARRKGVPFELTMDDLPEEYPETCPLLGVPLEIPKYSRMDGTTKSKGPQRHAPSLDRIDPDKGYVKGNIWIISVKANAMKSDATLEELKTLVYNLEREMRKKDEDASTGHRDEPEPQQDLAFSDETD